MKQLEATVWRARAAALRRAAEAAEAMADSCEDRSPKRKSWRVQVLERLVAVERASVEELHEVLGGKRMTIAATCKRLMDAGHLEREGWGRYAIAKVRP